MSLGRVGSGSERERRMHDVVVSILISRYSKDSRTTDYSRKGKLDPSSGRQAPGDPYRPYE